MPRQIEHGAHRLKERLLKTEELRARAGPKPPENVGMGR